MPNTPPAVIDQDTPQTQDVLTNNASTDALIAPTSEVMDSHEVFADALEEFPADHANASFVSTTSPTDLQFVPIESPVTPRSAPQTQEEDATAAASSPLSSVHQANSASLPPLHSEEAQNPVQSSSTTSAVPVVNRSLLTAALLARVEGMQQQYTKELSKRFVFNKARKEEKLAAAEQLIAESQITTASEAPATGSTQSPTTLNNVIDHVIAQHPQAMAGFFSKRFRNVIRAARVEAGVPTPESALQSLTGSTLSA